MRKILSLIVVFALMVCLCVSAFAADGKALSIYLSTEDDMSDGLLTVDINVADNPGFMAARLYVVYPEEFELVDYENGELYSQDCITRGNYNVPLSGNAVIPELKGIVESKGMETEGYNYVALYFEQETIGDTVTENGVLISLFYELTSDVDPNSGYDFYVLCAEDDVVDVFINESGMMEYEFIPTVTEGMTFTMLDSSCEHPKTEFAFEETGDSNGIFKQVCSDCNKVLYSEEFTDGYGCKLGDVKRDGKVNASDSLVAKRIAAGIDTPTVYQDFSADVNRDGRINAGDTNLISRYIGGVIVEF